MSTLEWLTEPVEADPPCGPDLELAEDDDFLDYYYDAEGRLPARYMDTGQSLGADGRPRDRLFDASSVDLAGERREIEGLLRRSRDLRPLSLLARWGALAWRTDVLADAVEGMAALVAAHGDAVHPALPERSRDRRGAIEALATPAHVIQPLNHLPLTGTGEVTWRRWQVAQGRVEPRAGEEEADGTAILQALGDRANASQVEAVQADLARVAAAARTLHPNLLERLLDTVDGILGLIAQARPELTAPAPDAPAPADAPEAGGAPAEAEASPAPAAVEELPADAPQDRAQAKAALVAVETYLARSEPASAALLLTIQARQLIGRPLVEALETLLPGDAPRAVIDLGSSGFALPMDRLKALSGEIPAPDAATAGEAAAAPEVVDRGQAAGQLRAIAAFFRRSEPASPVPLLLDRARTWLERDFEGLLSELLPPAAEG
ncbi:type VI secretion system ImpA family N-terminal domain-containing protein [Jannaschia sp. Os4]|uniref:type VI secretion system ImpA family N-terminal domain-containing protein n=1 Tax=Jannaschia sp. Os4 TaxID=2807617 RepID=UPI00193A9408|nr:type VI secretion system ImpA family N-terminal domain-containing protein [Jannaschia sp. Os4]MBM2578054.1 type VI secretion system ImpA family N-terminal domain-containing protein [Jannaschia sp. Os4]